MDHAQNKEESNMCGISDVMAVKSAITNVRKGHTSMLSVVQNKENNSFSFFLS